MCPPALMAGLSLAAGMAQGVMGFMGQKQQFKAQMETVRANTENAAKATISKYGSTQLRIMQEGKASHQSRFEAQIEGRKARATAETAAGEANVSGVSVDALVGDLAAQSGRFDSAAKSNLDMTNAFLSAEMDSQQAQGQGQINSIPMPEKPNVGAMVVGMFSSGVSAYSNYKQWS